MNFLAKIFPILYPWLENSTTRITINDDEVICILLSMTQLEVLSEDDLGISRWGPVGTSLFARQCGEKKLVTYYYCSNSFQDHHAYTPEERLHSFLYV
jgi:hypothetical protein